MRSKLLSILVVGLMALFLSGQAFACGAGTSGKSSDRDESPTYDQRTYNSDSDLNKDQDTTEEQERDINPDQSVDES